MIHLWSGGAGNKAKCFTLCQICESMGETVRCSPMTPFFCASRPLQLHAHPSRPARKSPSLHIHTASATPTAPKPRPLSQDALAGHGLLCVESDFISCLRLGDISGLGIRVWFPAVADGALALGRGYWPSITGRL